MLNRVSSTALRVACIVPTYNAGDDLVALFSSLDMQLAKFDLFAVDSTSCDNSFAIAKERCNNAICVPSKDFNHGGTRQMMVALNPGYDVYVFLTQDAILADRTSLDKILKPFSDPTVGAVCGRQLPHLDATPLAQHARIFNYPGESRTKSIDDARTLGIKTAFMSNSFAAYRAEALRQVGGFPTHVIFGEDMYVAAKMLLAGWRVAYAGDALCRHSHNYSVVEEFRRYFDMGVLHAREPWIRAKFGGARGEGVRYVRSELAFLGVGRLHLWPTSLFRNACKLLGYKIGRMERCLPVPLKRKLSMHRRYWDGSYASLFGKSPLSRTEEQSR